METPKYKKSLIYNKIRDARKRLAGLRVRRVRPLEFESEVILFAKLLKKKVIANLISNLQNYV
jgi:hypothetical protein